LWSGAGRSRGRQGGAGKGREEQGLGKGVLVPTHDETRMDGAAGALPPKARAKAKAKTKDKD
jgi:hypothetical protein